jgi:hypothetical protein
MKIIGDLGADHWVPGEGDRDTGPQLDATRVKRSLWYGEKWVVGAFVGVERIEPVPFEFGGDGPDLGQGYIGGKCSFYFHLSAVCTTLATR